MPDLEARLQALADHRARLIPAEAPTSDDDAPAPASQDKRPRWLDGGLNARILVVVVVVVVIVVAGIVAWVALAQNEEDAVVTAEPGPMSTMRSRDLVDRADWATPLDETGTAGTFALARVGDGNQTIDVAVSERARTGFLPAATFELLDALIILDTGALPDLDTVVPWDGVTHDIEAWNQDHTLRTAVRESAAWVFQQLTREVGAEAMADHVAAADYGNADIGGTIDSFWLDGELRVSAIDQLAFLEQLVLGQLPFDPDNQGMIVASLPRLDGPDSRISYKAGTALAAATPVAWLVGLVDTAEGQWVFAYNVDLRIEGGEPQVVSAQEALAVVVDLLVSADVLEP